MRPAAPHSSAQSAQSARSAQSAQSAQSARLDRTLSALANPARRVMLARLAKGRASASELGALVDVSQPAVSKHLKVLEDAGLISRGRDAQWRPCELRLDALEEVEAWMQEFHRTWEERLDRFGRYVHRSQHGAPPKDGESPSDEVPQAANTPESQHDQVTQRTDTRSPRRPGGAGT
jgi:DNA-binding transcriptional ArsR family regulator